MDHAGGRAEVTPGEVRGEPVPHALPVRVAGSVDLGHGMLLGDQGDGANSATVISPSTSVKFT